MLVLNRTDKAAIPVEIVARGSRDEGAGSQCDQVRGPSISEAAALRPSSALWACSSFRRQCIGGGAAPRAFPFPRPFGTSAAVCSGPEFLVWRARTCRVGRGPLDNHLLLVLRAAGSHHLHRPVRDPVLHHFCVLRCAAVLDGS